MQQSLGPMRALWTRADTARRTGEAIPKWEAVARHFARELSGVDV